MVRNSSVFNYLVLNFNDLRSFTINFDLQIIYTISIDIVTIFAEKYYHCIVVRRLFVETVYIKQILYCGSVG